MGRTVEHCRPGLSVLRLTDVISGVFVAKWLQLGIVQRSTGADLLSCRPVGHRAVVSPELSGLPLKDASVHVTGRLLCF